MRISFILLLFTLLLSSPAGADTLDGALNHMDKAGSLFKDMTANLKQVKHTAIVNEDTVSTGTIKIKKVKHNSPPDDIFGRLDFVAPDERKVVLNGKTVDIYLPNIKTVQEVDLGKHKGLVQQFFLLGFGTSRSDLEAAYNVSLDGEESLNGEKTTRLVLVSKKPDVARQLSKFELWISEKTGEPVQQKFYEPSGDYNVLTYSDMKINPKLSDSELEYHPKGYKKEILNQ